MDCIEYIKAIKGTLEGSKGKAKYIFGLIKTDKEEVQYVGSKYTGEVITNYYDLILNYDNKTYMWEDLTTRNCSFINLEDYIQELIMKIDNKEV